MGKRILKGFTAIAIGLFAWVTFSNSAEIIHFTGFKMTPNSCVIAGRAFINGVSLVDGDDEVAFFVGDGKGGELLVGASVMGAINPGAYFVNVYGDDPTTPEKDGALTGELLSPKIWDKSKEKEFTVSASSMTHDFEPELTLPAIPPEWSDAMTFGLLNLSIESSGYIPGDIDCNGNIGLEDLIITLQVLSGIDPTHSVCVEGEVNGDGRIDLPEAVYILQTLCTIRIH